MKLPRFFRLARMESLKSNVRRISMGAVISKGGSVIAKGHNQCKTHPMLDTYTIHAEMSALISRRYYDDLKGAVIWIYRETVDGIPGCAKPCASCLKHLVAAGIKKVYYSDSTPPYYKIIRL